MEKPANPDYPILDILKRRWSPRAFADRLVEPHKLRQLFEAARWAASSYNEQPYIFFVATKDDTEAFDRMVDCLTPANQQWAKFAPVLMLTATRPTFSRNGKPNRVHQHDLGLAMGNLTAQAMAVDLFVHQMAGIEPDKVRQTYSLPEGYEPQTAAAIGYGGEPAQLPEAFHSAEREDRSRRKLNEFVFGKTFGETSKLVVRE